MSRNRQFSHNFRFKKVTGKFWCFWLFSRMVTPKAMQWSFRFRGRDAKCTQLQVSTCGVDLKIEFPVFRKSMHVGRTLFTGTYLHVETMILGVKLVEWDTGSTPPGEGVMKGSVYSAVLSWGHFRATWGIECPLSWCSLPIFVIQWMKYGVLHKHSHFADRLWSAESLHFGKLSLAKLSFWASKQVISCQLAFSASVVEGQQNFSDSAFTETLVETRSSQSFCQTLSADERNTLTIQKPAEEFISGERLTFVC